MTIATKRQFAVSTYKGQSIASILRCRVLLYLTASSLSVCVAFDAHVPQFSYSGWNICDVFGCTHIQV